jgi:magnesium transporter
VGDVELSDAFRVMRREVGQGVLLGALLGTIGFFSAHLFDKGSDIGAVVGVTLLLVVTTGSLVGSMLPIVLTRLGFDPALASSPFVSSLVDVAGILIYVNVAIVLLASA